MVVWVSKVRVEGIRGFNGEKPWSSGLVSTSFGEITVLGRRAFCRELNGA